MIKIRQISNTAVVVISFFALLIATVVVDILNGPAPPPMYLIGMLGAVSGAFFTVVGSSKAKSQAEMASDAKTAKSRMVTLNEDVLRNKMDLDQLARIAKEQHPEIEVPEPLINPTAGDKG